MYQSLAMDKDNEAYMSASAVDRPLDWHYLSRKAVKSCL